MPLQCMCGYVVSLEFVYVICNRFAADHNKDILFGRYLALIYIVTLYFPSHGNLHICNTI